MELHVPTAYPLPMEDPLYLPPGQEVAFFPQVNTKNYTPVEGALFMNGVDIRYDEVSNQCTGDADFI